MSKEPRDRIPTQLYLISPLGLLLAWEILLRLGAARCLAIAAVAGTVRWAVFATTTAVGALAVTGMGANTAAVSANAKATGMPLVEAAFPGTAVNGGASPRVPNTTNISVDRVEAESLLIALDLEGIAGIEHQRIWCCDQRVPVGGRDVGAGAHGRIGLRMPKAQDIPLDLHLHRSPSLHLAGCPVGIIHGISPNAIQHHQPITLMESGCCKSR